MQIGQSVLVTDPTGHSKPFFGKIFWFLPERPQVDVMELFSGSVRKVPIEWCLFGDDNAEDLGQIAQKIPN